MRPGNPLDAAMGRLQVPQEDASARERALHRAAIALRQSGAATEFAADAGDSVGEMRDGFGAKWAILGSLGALIGLVLAIGFWQTGGPLGTEAGTTPRIGADEVLLGDIKALFGRQLNAVVEYAGKAPDIRLSEEAEPGLGGQLQPVLIEFRRGGDFVRVLGFSGRSVCLQLAGHETCLEPLATGDGGVIITTKRFCWTPQDRNAQLYGFQISAQLLSSS